MFSNALNDGWLQKLVDIVLLPVSYHYPLLCITRWQFMRLGSWEPRKFCSQEAPCDGGIVQVARGDRGMACYSWVDQHLIHHITHKLFCGFQFFCGSAVAGLLLLKVWISSGASEYTYKPDLFVVMILLLTLMSHQKGHAVMIPPVELAQCQVLGRIYSTQRYNESLWDKWLYIDGNCSQFHGKVEHQTQHLKVTKKISTSGFQFNWSSEG